jgi:hypothetical protein
MWIILLLVGCVTTNNIETRKLILNPCKSIQSRVVVNEHIPNKTLAVRSSIHILFSILGDTNNEWEYFYGGYFAMLAPTVATTLEHLKFDLQIFHMYALEFQLTAEAEAIRILRCEVEDISRVRRMRRILNVNVFILKIIKPTMDALQIVICKHIIIDKLKQYLQTVNLNIMYNVTIDKTHKYVDMIKNQIHFLNINK